METTTPRHAAKVQEETSPSVRASLYNLHSDKRQWGNPRNNTASLGTSIHERHEDSVRLLQSASSRVAS